MHRNFIWISFLCLLLLILLGYTARTGYQLWQYMRLDQQTQVQTIQWSIMSFSDEEFIPLARYHFHFNGQSYQGETLWHETYLNAATAQEAIVRLPSLPHVWFDSSSPDISSLEKIFPFKAIFYTIILWIIGFYFLALGYYVKRY